ncbi:MAG: hypothetical protein ACLTAI_05800 [Thomasclavelia sp.]
MGAFNVENMEMVHSCCCSC